MNESIMYIDDIHTHSEQHGKVADHSEHHGHEEVNDVVEAHQHQTYVPSQNAAPVGHS